MAKLLLLQNELAILEFIHCLVETLDRYFSNVCELDLMFNLEMASALSIAARVATTYVSCFNSLAGKFRRALMLACSTGTLYCG